MPVVTLVQSIAAVGRILEADRRVSAALLFGSAATGRTRPGSDLDVGLVCVDRAACASLDADLLRLTGEAMIEAEREVQLVLVESAPPALARQVFAHGRTLFDRDPNRTARVLERVLLAYFDGAYHRRVQHEAHLERLGVTDG